jgi:hypothetical protein
MGHGRRATPEVIDPNQLEGLLFKMQKWFAAK